MSVEVSCRCDCVIEAGEVLIVASLLTLMDADQVNDNDEPSRAGQWPREHHFYTATTL